MLRGDNIICGTTTTGTGTLTLAATPVPPGGVDFDVFARAAGIGFGNSAVIIVSYTIIEYTDGTFASAKAHEKGAGTLTLGGSSGITNATLARTLPQTTATSLNAQPATQNILPGTGISIGTAANTLVFIGASAADVLAVSPFVDVTTSNNGVPPLQSLGDNNQNCSMTSGTEYYVNFFWPIPRIVKSVFVSISGTYTGQTNNLYARLYAVSGGGTNAAGRPGKLLFDYGVVATAGSSFASGFAAVTASAGTGFFLMPGSYFMSFLAIFTGGGTGTPGIYGTKGMIVPGNIGTDGAAINFVGPPPMTSATSGNATAPDPANTTGYGPTGLGGGGAFALNFGLKAT